MNALRWAAAVSACVGPLLVLAWVVVRSRHLSMQGRRIGWIALLGAVVVAPLVALLRAIETWANIDPIAGTGGSLSLLLYAFTVLAPLQMATVVLLVAPFWRARRRELRAGLSRSMDIREGVVFASAAGVAFAAASGLRQFAAASGTWWTVARVALAVPTFSLLCAGWGYVLGRHAERGMRSRRFSSAWFAATVFHAASEQLIFRSGPNSLLIVMTLLVCLLAGAWVLWRDQRTPAEVSSGRFSMFTSGPAPSLETIRDAFRQHDRPITFRWITFGALVTIGLITTGFAGAVYAGHKSNIDFSAIDHGGDVVASLLLASGALSAFPVSGYLLARASRTRSVLEPAISAALSILLTMVFLGLVDPRTVVFAVTLTPFAFLLSCVGAWVGMGH